MHEKKPSFESDIEKSIDHGRAAGELAVAAEIVSEDIEREEGSEYKVLDVGFLRNETPEDLRVRYIYLTDRLIKRLCGYGEPADRPDTVIFLDKSARPVS